MAGRITLRPAGGDSDYPSVRLQYSFELKGITSIITNGETCILLIPFADKEGTGLDVAGPFPFHPQHGSTTSFFSVTAAVVYSRLNRRVTWTDPHQVLPVPSTPL